jgi:hypothetical protein
MPQQRSTREYVFIGIRLACAVVLIVSAIHDYRRGGSLTAFESVLFLPLMWAFSHSHAQGKKLADENMCKAGLNPDRD